MEETNHFTCMAYDNVDFLIQSNYVIFGIYLKSINEDKSVTFESEVLPHIYIGHYLEQTFLCKPVEECYVMLVMNKEVFDKKIQKQITDFTNTKFPPSGNFALSLNSEISSKIIDLSLLKLIPKGIRQKQNNCGITAIGFQQDSKSSTSQRKQILISTDSLLKQLFNSQVEK